MAASYRKQQHALAIPLPAQGHINPLMRFCKKLARDEGVMVTFVNIDPIHYRIQELQQLQAAAPAPSSTTRRTADDDDCEGASLSSAKGQQSIMNKMIRRAHVPIEGLDLSQGFALSLQTFFEAQKSITPHLHHLLQQYQLNINVVDQLSAGVGAPPPVTFIISDVCMTAPTQHLADAFHLPRVVFYPSSQSTLLFYRHLLDAGSEISTKGVLEAVMNQAGRSSSLDEIFAENLEGLPRYLRVRDLPHFRHVVDDNLYMFPFMECELLECFQKAHSIVVNSCEELEGPAFKAILSGRVNPPIYAVGPLEDDDELAESTNLWKEDEACMGWLDKQPPLSVLYISFGSVTLLSYAQFQEIVGGLLSSQQRFLWVLRPGLIEGAPPAQYGAGNSPFDFVSQTQGRGCIVDWAPQLRVLAHPAVGAFLSHCGWNSTMEAVYHGIPMLCWPYFADQHLDAKFVVEEWKTGLRFEANPQLGVVESKEFERVVNAVMQEDHGEHLRENATKLKDASRQSISPQGSSYRNVQALLTSLP